MTFNAPPRRVVILNPAIADILIDLGVGNRIVAQSGTNSLAEPLPQNKAVMDRVPVLSAAGMTSTGCGNGQNGKVTDVFTDIDNYGEIFDVRDKAKQLVDRLRVRLDGIEARVGDKPKLPVFEFYRLGGQFSDTAVGVEKDALIKSGGVSIFSNTSGMKPTSKEAITARNPQAFIELVKPGDPVDPVKEAATLKRAFPTTDAAKNGRIYCLDVAEAASPGTPRIIDGIAVRAKWLHPEAFASP
ncbi:ABC transporter substrate-binding protein [Mycobacterium sp. SM1]|uniref:ABC transporter substrate-binding protein n=1 Tax=Mycobacterium sp. SM1 TaxID=2816243 RepID=UPI001BCFBD2C|nr:ABC transporter substrate-binding protein [Mycobacterium sp. SM1]MBS4728326.1 ABC transporter substrate-binding protein [Mycobacterium sp. SM1]